MTNFAYSLINESVKLNSTSASVLARCSNRKKRGRIMLTAHDIRQACQTIAPAAVCYDSTPASMLVQYKELYPRKTRGERLVASGALRKRVSNHFRSFRGVRVRPWEYVADYVAKSAKNPSKKATKASATPSKPNERSTAFLLSVHELAKDSSEFAARCHAEIERHRIDPPASSRTYYEIPQIEAPARTNERYPRRSHALPSSLSEPAVSNSHAPRLRRGVARSSEALPSFETPLGGSPVRPFRRHAPPYNVPPHSEARRVEDAFPSATGAASSSASSRFFSEEDLLGSRLEDHGNSRIWFAQPATLPSAQPTPVKPSALASASSSSLSPTRVTDTVERATRREDFNPLFLLDEDEEDPRPSSVFGFAP